MTVDLDEARAARKEAQGEGPVLKLDGKEYKLPPELPYEVLESIRGLQSPETAAGALVDFTRAILGKDYEKIKTKLSFNDLETLVEGIMKDYGITAPLEPSSS